MFEIGDVVRLIPPDYSVIHKTFNSPYHWDQSNPDVDKTLMLGGKYSILELPENFGSKHVFYSLLKNSFNNMDKTLGDFLLPDKDVINCLFKVGDVVKLAISDEEIKKQFFSVHHRGYSFADKNVVYQITDVLNNFYIFLNYPKGHPKSAPFRWDNFKKA